MNKKDKAKSQFNKILAEREKIAATIDQFKKDSFDDKTIKIMEDYLSGLDGRIKEYESNLVALK